MRFQQKHISKFLSSAMKMLPTAGLNHFPAFCHSLQFRNATIKLPEEINLTRGGFPLRMKSRLIAPSGNIRNQFQWKRLIMWKLYRSLAGLVFLQALPERQDGLRPQV